jgi:hypothetical protein
MAKSTWTPPACWRWPRSGNRDARGRARRGGDVDARERRFGLRGRRVDPVRRGGGLRQKGQQAFVERFVRGSPLAERMAAEGAEQLRHIEAVLGPIQGFSVISRKSLGARSCYVVGVLEYTNGPAFTGVLYYARPEGSVPISLRLEAEPDEVFTYPVLIGSD